MLFRSRETMAETGVRCTVERNLGRRIHPTTNVLCEYLLCVHVTGNASNVDTAENAEVRWVHKERIIYLVPQGQIYKPILKSLKLPRDELDREAYSEVLS